MMMMMMLLHFNSMRLVRLARVEMSSVSVHRLVIVVRTVIKARLAVLLLLLLLLLWRHVVVHGLEFDSV